LPHWGAKLLPTRRLGQHLPQRPRHDADLGFEPGPSELEDLRLIGCLVRAGGDVTMTATGAAVMGHPAASVVWLVNQLPEGRACGPGSWCSPAG
jgi:hypothetical protein